MNITTKKPPLKLQTWTVISNNQFMGADRLLVCSLLFYYTVLTEICQETDLFFSAVYLQKHTGCRKWLEPP